MLQWIILLSMLSGSYGAVATAYLSQARVEIPIGHVDGMYMFTPWSPSVIDVRFFVHDPSHLEVPRRVLAWNSSLSPLDDLFGVNDKLKFIIHGYTESSQEMWIGELKDILLKKDPKVKVILVDWSIGSYFDHAWYVLHRYFQAANNALMVGRVLACFIQSLMFNYNMPETSVHLLGHSMGAQVMGRAAAYLSETFHIRIGEATALDAASPFFSWKGLNPDRRHVHFMEAWHTSSTTSWTKLVEGAIGVYQAFGDVNLYPNHGTIIQPACRRENFFFCSHRRAYIYYLDSITRCNTNCDFQGSVCETEADAIRGVSTGRVVDVCKFTQLAKTYATGFNRTSFIFTFDTVMDQLYMRCNNLRGIAGILRS